MISDVRWAAAFWLVVVLTGLVFVVINRRKRVEPISRNLPVIGVAFLASLFVMAVQAARMQVFQQGTFARRVGTDPETGEVLANPRLSLADTRNMRGSILDSGGAELAWSVDAGLHVQRRYSDADISHVAGYFSPVLYGKDGIELAANQALTVGKQRSIDDQLLGGLGLDDSDPENIQLTIDPSVQRLAQALLGVSIGAAVVINVQTGAVIALASNPVVDPGGLTAVTVDDVDAAKAYWAALNRDERRPLLRRSTLGLYTPGSIFKVVTAAAAIDSGVATPEQVYEDDGVFTVDGHTIIETNRPDDTVTQWTLTEGLAYSLNVVFAQVGLELGAGPLREYAEAFGFGESVPFEYPVAESQVASSTGFLNEPAALADTAFGQGELLTTPVHMALLAASIANGGAMMRPYLIERYLDRDGSVLETADPSVWRRPISEETADTVAEMMVVAVEGGYAGGAFVPGLTIGGKTGTAETGEGEPHGWFIGFGGARGARYAVSVVLEHGGSGGGLPSTIAGSLLSRALSG